jgi:uncharacterized protein (TIGR00369 family)
MSEMPPLPATPFDRHIGNEIVEASPDLVRSRCAVTEALKQPYGVVHGGVFAAMAESLASLGTHLGVTERGELALGQSNSTQFLRPVSSGVIHAAARPRHRGRTSWVWDVDITDDSGALCALSRLTIAVRPARRG